MAKITRYRKLFKDHKTLLQLGDLLKVLSIISFTNNKIASSVFWAKYSYSSLCFRFNDITTTAENSEKQTNSLQNKFHHL